MRRLGVQTVMWEGQADQIADLVNAMADQGFEVPLLNPGSTSYSEAFLEQAGAAAEGARIDVGERQPHLDVRARQDAVGELRLDAPVVHPAAGALDAERRGLELEPVTLEWEVVLDLERAPEVGVVVVGLCAECWCANGEGDEQRRRGAASAADRTESRWGVLARASDVCEHEREAIVNDREARTFADWKYAAVFPVVVHSTSALAIDPSGAHASPVDRRAMR
jgi:hypothetical protein